jgi:ATP-binding cassette subfamily B protein
MADLPPVPPPKGKVSQLKRLVRFLLPYRGRIAVAMLALLVAAGTVLALGQGLKYVIDAGFGSSDSIHLNTALAGVVALAVVLSVATFGRFYLMMSTGERVVTDIRRAVFDHVLELSPGYFDSARTGEIVSRILNDTTQLQVVVGFGFSMFLRNGLMMVGALVLLFVTSAKLAAFIVLGVPAILIPIFIIGRRVRKLSRENQDRVADVSSYVDEVLHEIRTVQAYAHEDADRRLFGAHADAACASGVERVRVKAWLISMVMLIGFCAIGVILWIGGHDVIAGRLSAGQLSAFVFYAVVVASGAGTVSEVWGEIQRAAGATERLMELLESEPDIHAPAVAVVLPQRVAGALRLDNLSFAYPSRPDVPALAGISLEVAPGERVALVGPSGSGKSTLFALLLRFYDPQSGRVLIDGTDIALCDPRAVRRHIALVPQDPVIFAASVTDNVRYGRPDASADEVRAACEAAHATEFIARLPEGFDTQLGERGVKLSGGQRQRLSIARAILANREILLLDEATSSLDAESERLVSAALDRLSQGRATLVIAHRLATVQRADRIVVLEHGRVHSVGRHADLMREDGLYAHLARLQFLDMQEAAGVAA